MLISAWQKHEYFLRIIYILGGIIWTSALNQLEYQGVIGVPLRRTDSDLAFLENQSVCPREEQAEGLGPRTTCAGLGRLPTAVVRTSSELSTSAPGPRPSLEPTLSASPSLLYFLSSQRAARTQCMLVPLPKGDGLPETGVVRVNWTGLPKSFSPGTRSARETD